jgi:hypothetical protein
LHRFHIERYNLKKINEVEGKVQYCVEDLDRFTALEDLYAEVDINIAWEIIRENIKISVKVHYELKKHKPCFYSMLKVITSKETSQTAVITASKQINGYNLNNVRYEARCFRMKKREYLEDKIKEPAMNSKNKNTRALHRGINYLVL